MRREVTFVARARCRYAQCPNEVISRGCCNTHYQVALRAVKMKKATWEQLEKAGKTDRPQRRALEWFLEGIED